MILQAATNTRRAQILVLTLFALTFLADSALSQQPRLVISSVEVPEHLSAHERYLLNELDWVAELRTQLQQSRSVILLARDQKSIESILQEKQLADSDLGRGDDPDRFGLVTGDSILRPIVKKFEVWTNHKPIELLDDVDERTDIVTIEYAIRIMGTDGVERFSKEVSARYDFPTIEETSEEKRRGRFRNAEPLRSRSDALVSELVGAVALRINPITVIDVQESYFVIDRGLDGGITTGDRFQVFAPSKVVEHAVNKRKIRIPGKRIGEAEITEAHDDIAFAKMIVTDASDPEVGVGYTLRTSGDNQ